ncbi:MAG: rod shape-determining protein MreC [Thermoleophilia bacterium]|nr:rod shape-determining protein MreC [Thermoleophilia bacterium]
MPRKTVARRRLVFAALVLTALVLLSAFFREPATGVLHSVQRSGFDVLSPLQSLASRAVQPFQDGYRWSKDLMRANSRNREMTRELESMRGQLVLLEEARQENDRLKSLLELKDADIFPKGSTFVTARVIGRSPTRWQEWVQIDRGTADGVALNQPVVGATIPTDQSLSGKGLVGKVIAVGEHAAQVQLIIDPESSVAAVVQGASDRPEGIVEGMIPGKLLMDFVERDKVVELKRIVITSGFGQIFPKGIPIGLVESVGEEDVNIYKQIEVRPFVDFSILEEVMVLTNPAPAGEAVEDMSSIAPQQDMGTGGQ